MTNGKGRIIYSSGEVYEGEWKNDKFHGHGIYYDVDGSTYTGEWADDTHHGYGI